MRYRRSVCVIFALVMASGATAQTLPASDQRISTQPAEDELTGYWRTAEGEIYYFQQDGPSLTSRYWQKNAKNGEGDVDFTATVHGNLIYGAHRGPLFRVMQKKCLRQIWVGMGLTLSEDRNELKGFRGDRTVDPKNCRSSDSKPVDVVYTRIPDFDPLR